MFSDITSLEEYWSGILYDGPLLEFVRSFSHDQTRVMDFGEEDHVSF